MLIASSALRGYAIQASDGAIARVGDLLFDEVSWKVRWIVAEAGTWLTERKLLLHPSAIRTIDYDREVLVAALTKAQVEASPPVFEHGPVSRQMELCLSTYYGSDRLWGDGCFGAGVLAPPLSMGSRFGADDASAEDRCSVMEGDPHLRSISEIGAYHIHATDGAIGHVEDFLIDDARWDVRFLVVDTRNWWPGKHVLVPTASVRGIDYASAEIKLCLDRDQVRSTPAWDPGAMIGKVYDGQSPNRDGWRGVGF